MPRLRLDELVVSRGLATDLRVARGLVMGGRIMVTEPERGERKIDKVGAKIDAGSSIRIAGDQRRFVSRAGDKLDAALETFDVEIRDRVCADLGASTGGFTDCLLSRGAHHVYAVDLAQGIIDWRIRTDERVTLFERTDARAVTPALFDRAIDCVTIDLSLLSLTLVWRAVRELLKEGQPVIALIKPQYEVAKADLVDGIVLDDGKREAAVAAVAEAAEVEGLQRRDVIPCPVLGTKGNREYLGWFEVRS